MTFPFKQSTDGSTITVADVKRVCDWVVEETVNNPSEMDGMGGWLMWFISEFAQAIKDGKFEDQKASIEEVLKMEGRIDAMV